MKNILIIVMLILSAETLSQQPGWVWQNPKPQGNTVNDIQFVNGNTGYMTCDAGILLKTINGGANWSHIPTPMYRNNYAVYFFNELTGFVAGKGIVKTTDGGSTWQQLLDINFFFTSISFMDANTGFFAGYTGSIGVIYKTTNGGNDFQIYNISTMLNSMQMLDVNTGYCTGISLVFKTTNSGVNWNSLGSTNSANATKVLFVNSNTGFISCANGDICRTGNGGINWSIINSGSTRANSIDFLDVNTGLAACNTGLILKTTNSGNNWFTVHSGITENFITVKFIDSQTYLAGGVNGNIFKSTNGGLNWNKLNSAFTFNEINSGSFVDQNTGYFFAEGEIIKTTNQGMNWSVSQIDSSSGMSGGYISNNGVIYVYGYNMVKRSLNGGITFNNIFNITNNQINCVYFLNASTGYLGASNNKIFKTTDAGLSWEFRSPSGTGVGYVVKDLLFVNDSMGYACGSSGWVNRTTNSGKVWISDYLGYLQDHADMFFINSTTGFMTGNNFIQKTTNSGINWIRYNVQPGGGDINSVFFTDLNTGYISGLGGRIYKSINGGVNWSELNSGCAQHLYAIKFVNSNTGFVFGRNGTIMKTTDAGGQITGTDPVIQVIPENYSLSQNYPNPFNPVTNIKYQIPKSGFVKISIYNLLGKEIVQLVNQQMQPGSYYADWDASNYPSGVYFYKLETDGFVDSKKMVLVK